MRFRDASLRERFERDGFAVVDVLNAAEVAHLRNLWDAFDDPVKHMPFNVTIMSGDVAYRRRVHHEIASIVGAHQQRLLDDVRFCYGSLVAKPPSNSAAGTVPLHQDPSFVDESSNDTYNFWIALQDVTLESGCLHVVKGSHVLNRFPRSSGAFFAFPYPELLDAIAGKHLQPVPVRAGQAVVTYQTLFHMSFPNRTARTRLAVSGLAVPANTPLRYYYQPFGSWTDPLDVYDVDDEFYIRHRMNEPPTGIQPIDRVAYRREDVSIERLTAAAGGSAA